ncbi:NAD-dependent epimerase/dehydratase family protein [Brevibacillus reuszeri]|uniref:NAD-dependent epimerase/dehydratase family protein n=1 Tax=Brevibacillus reuszeri TaxID=54915 RepID=UPI0036704E93
MGRSESIRSELQEKGIRFVQADLREEESVVHACAGQDVVFHCGEMSSPWGQYREFHAVDVEGTGHVVDGCRKQNVLRLIHISTPSIYFDYRDRGGISDSEPLPVKQVIAYVPTKLLELQQTRYWRRGG